MLKAVFFDLGGTLVSYKKGNLLSLGYAGAQEAYRALQEKEVALPKPLAFNTKVMTTLTAAGASSVMSQEEIDIEGAIGDLFRQLSVELTPEQLALAVTAWHRPFAEDMQLDPDAVACLEALREKGLPLGLITNSVWRRPLIEADLEQLGIRDFFDSVTISSEVGYRKPHPSIFKSALEALNVEPETAVFVGDDPRADVGGAMGVGMKTILKITKGTSSGPPADATIQRLSELPDVVEAIGT